MDWVKKTDIAEFPAWEKFAPIEIQPGSLGPGVPSRRLVVSPQHRIVLHAPEAQLLFGETEVLCAAKALVNARTITQSQQTTVEYFHFLLEKHSVIMAEGCKSESLYPGRQGLYRFGAAEQEEIFSLFPELRSLPASYGQSARPILRNFETKLLLEVQSA